MEGENGQQPTVAQTPSASKRPSLFWRLVGFSRWVVALLIVALAVQVGILAFPQVLFANRTATRSVVVYHREGPHRPVRDLAEETDRRLTAGGFGNPNRPERIFLIRNPRLYALFARLARVPVGAQGFGISVLRNTFVSTEQVLALGERTGQKPRYSVWEGSISHTMAHEVAHVIMVDSIGRATWKDLPQWKQEGYPEYIANIGLLREDPAASLQARIWTLLDDTQWSGPRSWDRIHYEAGLMVEFLLDVQGLDLQNLISDTVTREETYAAMMAWFREGTSS